MAPVKNLREAYGQALVALGRHSRQVVALEADLGKSTRSALFEDAFPDRYFQMGIAEQNMASTAAGLALAGKVPFMHSFAVFASGRAFDQLRNSVCIPGLPVRICGSSCGLSDFGDGKTHQALEDVGIMRVLPGMTILCPADAIEVGQMVRRTSRTTSGRSGSCARVPMPPYSRAASWSPRRWRRRRRWPKRACRSGC
jgi:transketolase